MAPYIGRNAVITFGGVTLNTVYRTAKSDESVELIDKTAGADTSKSYLTGFRDTTFDVDILLDGTAAWAACAPGTEGTLISSPEGTAAGKPKYTAVAICAKRTRSQAYNDLATASLSFTAQAPFTEGTH